jgi:hypothetical protein
MERKEEYWNELLMKDPKDLTKKERKSISDRKYRIKNNSTLNEKKTQYYQKNRETHLIKCKQWRDTHKEIKKETDKQYLLKNRERLLKYKKEYYKKNKEHLTQVNKIYREENKNKYIDYKIKNREKLLQRKRDWSRRNKEHVNQYAKNKRDTDIQFKLRTNLRNRINSAIIYQKTTKHCSTLKLLGCSIQEAKDHLEKQFRDGMTWDNYAHKGWHIDHIIPCVNFDLTDLEEQRKCFHYTNLQPLWWWENISKRDKIIQN